jgi:hypothetical protein
VSPIINIPIYLFFPSVLFGMPFSSNWKFIQCLFFLPGLMPYNFICVQTGCLLSSVTSISDVFTWSMSLKLGGIACAALVPGLMLRRFRKTQTKIV